MPSPTSPASASFLVGDFLVAPDRNELRQLDQATGRPSGEPVKLTSKQMDVLVTLAAKAGQPVSKNDLFEAVWPGVTVGEDNISSCIYELRKALGTPYIQTVRNRGYLLAARVERDLPPGLLEALEPPRRESAETLLAGGIADTPLEPAHPRTPPPPPERFDRPTIRNLAIAFGTLALLIVAGLLGIRHWGIFTVGIQDCENRTGEPDLDNIVESWERQFFTDLDDPDGQTYYRVREIGFFAGTQISCSLVRGTDPEGGDFELRAIISGDRTGTERKIHMIATRDGFQRVGNQLIESVRRELDSRVCHMDTEDTLLKAKHCLEAGKRFVKSRSYQEAEGVLLRAARIYLLLITERDGKAAAQGLLDTRDLLSNLYDILGKIKEAQEQIESALVLIQDPALGLGLESPIALRIKRRSAQIAEDPETEKRYLDEMLNQDPDNPDVRHSMGWFALTHERNCGSALNELEKAMEGEQDPLIRATYFSYKGDVQLTCGLPKAAIESYRLHITALPEEADPYDARATALIMVGRYREAQEDLSVARKLDPNLATVLLKKAERERDLGNFQNARRDYKTALQSFGQWPNDHRDILMGFGRLALLQGKYSAAAENAREAINLKGGNQVQPYWLRGVSSLALGKVDDARAALEVLEKRFASTNSKYLREYLHHLRAQLLLADGRGEDALRELNAALDIYPADRLFFLTAKAEALEKLGRFPEALAVYDEILAINDHHLRSICAAAKLAEKVAPQRTADLYGDARDILELEQSPQEDPVRRTCLELAVKFLDGP